MLETREDIRQEDQAQKISKGLKDLTINLRGQTFTEEQWQAIRLAWVEFAEVFAPTREPQKVHGPKSGDKLMSDNYDQTMKELFE